MWGYRTRGRHKHRAAVPERQRLWLEHLEERGSPTVLLLEGFAGASLEAPPAAFVSDVEHVTAAVAVTGAEQTSEAQVLSLTPSRSESFQVADLLLAAEGGDLSVTDAKPAASDAPSIQGFHGCEGEDGWWTFSGRVETGSPGGLIVSFGGLATLQGQVVEVEHDGTFSFTIQLTPCEQGMVTAQTTGWGGQVSNLATDYVHQTSCTESATGS
jgi:hypothetical protein